MRVYPVNAMDAAKLSSLQTALYNKLEDIYNRYIEYQIDFLSDSIEITGAWDTEIPFDAFIIGNTNAVSGKLAFYKGQIKIDEKNITLNEHINIITNKDKMGKIKIINIDRFILTLQGTSNVKVGYLFIGRTWTLPRFTTAPKNNLQLRNDSGRTFSGQVTGIPQDVLRSFSCNFIRIENKDIKLIDEYINGVQAVIPHVIDPYYEAHEEFAPLFATISSLGEKEKRSEKDKRTARPVCACCCVVKYGENQ